MLEIETYKEKNNEILSRYYPQNIISDGIISPEDYIKREIKVMIINREPNDSGKEYDLPDEVKKAIDGKKAPFGECRTFTKSIKNDLVLATCLKDLEISRKEFEDKINKADLPHLLKGIAICNIKKTGGEGTVDWNEMFKAYDDNCSIILDQIEYYNPTIIFSGNLVDKIFERESGDFKWSELDIRGEKYKFYICEIEKAEKKYLLVDLYHPSYPWLDGNVDYWYEVLCKLRDKKIDIRYHLERSKK